MSVMMQIKQYIASQPGKKRSDMEVLHQLLLCVLPEGKLWFLDGTNNEGKMVSNPNIGYGSFLMKYADGTSREFYHIGMSANTTGISIYIMGIADKNYLTQTYTPQLGKANVSGYCIKFRHLKDIHLDVLEAAIRDGVKQTTIYL